MGTAFVIGYLLSDSLSFSVNLDISIYLEIPLRLFAICAILYMFNLCHNFDQSRSLITLKKGGAGESKLSNLMPSSGFE